MDSSSVCHVISHIASMSVNNLIAHWKASAPDVWCLKIRNGSHAHYYNYYLSLKWKHHYMVYRCCIYTIMVVQIHGCWASGMQVSYSCAQYVNCRMLAPCEIGVYRCRGIGTDDLRKAWSHRREGRLSFRHLILSTQWIRTYPRSSLMLNNVYDISKSICPLGF